MTFDGSGTHGTTAYHAISIRQYGFDPEKTVLGRAGKGCYFWAYDSNTQVADQLAYEWWKHSSKKKRYDESKDCSFVLFKVSLSTKQENVFDAHSLEFREAFDELKQAPKNSKKTPGKICEEIISLFQDKYRKIIQNNNFKYHLVYIDLSLPSDSEYFTPFSKGYPAYVVMDKTVISIKDDMQEPAFHRNGDYYG